MKNLLVLTHSAGYRHDYLPTAAETIKHLGEQSGLFKAVATEDCALLSPKELKKFDAFLFATTGELPIPDEQKTGLLDAIRAGKGFIGVHNATDTFYKFPAYGEMLGGYFSGHPWRQEVTVKVEDRSHPATRHLPATLKATEEIYTFKDWSRSKTHVLMSLDNSSVDLSKGTRPDNDYALCWCHNYGKGRIFYTGFGHFKEIWAQEWLQKHVLNGILWTMKMIE
jgi:hypothetical protein